MSEAPHERPARRRFPFVGRRDALSRDRDFLWFWAGQGISQVGAQFSALAIPVLAVTLLGADEFEMGVLNASSTAAFLLVGLPAGAWVDRWLKRRTMIIADLVRALALAVIPVLWFTGSLELWHLVVVSGVLGVATVFFDVSYQSYIPVLVAGAEVGGANSRLEATAQVARIGVPGIAGGLLAIVSAPVLLIADAVTYLASAFSLTRVHDTEVEADPAQRRPLAVEIAEGVRFVAHHRIIRRIVGSTAAFNLFGTMTFTLLPIFILRDLAITPAGLGLMLSFGAAGGLLGAVLTPRLTKLIGEGRVISVSAVASALVLALIPIAELVPVAVAIPLLVVAEFAQSFLVLVYNITQVTMRQRVCPPPLLGRMNASIRFVVWGVMPLSALAAGVLGSTIGVLPTLWIAVVGSVLGSGFVLFSPLTTMREVPQDALPRTSSE